MERVLRFRALTVSRADLATTRRLIKKGTRSIGAVRRPPGVDQGRPGGGTGERPATIEPMADPAIVAPRAPRCRRLMLAIVALPDPQRSASAQSTSWRRERQPEPRPRTDRRPPRHAAGPPSRQRRRSSPGSRRAVQRIRELDRKSDVTQPS